MDTGLIILLTGAWGFIFFIIQRTEAKKRRGVSVVMAFLIIVLIWYVSTIQVWREALTAIFFALILNFLFWLFIGRYNPVGNSDDIHVLGMDD